MFSDKDQLVTLYGYDAKSKVYTGDFQYFWSHGTGLAVNSTLTPPPQIPEGYCALYQHQTDSWEIVENHYDKQSYSITDKTASKVDYYGPLKPGYTLLEPGEFDSWTEAGWQDLRTDAEKREAYLRTFPELSKRQFNLYMFDNGLSATVDAILAENPRAKIEFDSTDKIFRHSPTLEAMIKALGWEDSQVDSMWQEASLI